MDIKPYDKTIRDLLSSQHQFVIPRFQREYSWDKNNVLELLNDIVNNLSVEGGEIKTSPYFLGTMLFIGNFVETVEKEIIVVDGQQRITSITILFSAMSDIFREIGEEALSKRLFEYIMTKDDNDADIKVLKSKSSEVFFSLFIQDRLKEEKVEPQSEEDDNILETYNICRAFLQEEQLRKFLKKKFNDQYDGVQYVDILKAIRDQILGCTFVAISTKDKNQANKIFEILNAKGKRLAHVDLIKNKIFEIYAQTEPLDVAEMKWSKVKDYCNDCEIGFGTFYRHFWLSKYKRVGASHLYDSFLEIGPKDLDSVKDFLTTLVKESENYSRIIKPNLEYYENRKEYNWLVQALRVMSQDFNIAIVRIPILALMSLKDANKVSSPKFKEAIQYIEGFHFAYSALLSCKTNVLETLYSKFAIAVRESKSKPETNQIIDDLLYAKLEPLFPEYTKFEEKFIKMTFSKKYSPDNLKSRYAIWMLNAYHSGTDSFDNNESIEHIAPESGGESMLTIGNLISLESSLNIEADQKTYEEKKPIYKRSKYTWIKDFVDQYPEWDATKFEERAKMMANEYYYGVLKRKKEDKM